MQAQVWGSVGEQQTLKPAIEDLKKQQTKLGTPDALCEAKFTAYSGFHSEVNLEFMATIRLDTYIVDTAFRSEKRPLNMVGKCNLKQAKQRIAFLIPIECE
ncbi:hypothetical protein ACLKMH_10935 [Psychromonas sp. KJ10-10]|uniref:hypothetical protein n=1 Tax=Psychromonas sp. KJ10-10 TaxID=3391823 RepID=UPI0039B4698D